MSKTRVRPSNIQPCQFEADPFAELVKSLAAPFGCELEGPPVRESKRDRTCLFVDERQIHHPWADPDKRQHPPKPTRARK